MPDFKRDAELVILKPIERENRMNSFALSYGYGKFLKLSKVNTTCFMDRYQGHL